MIRCPRCGATLQADAPAGLCAACLLLAGSETFASATLDDLATVTAHGLDDRGVEGPKLTPGQTWGPYRVGPLLGRGGMGEVYEAEHTGSGRRVALKVLRGRLRHADRARFLREGQLAASISHPHSVYIYGSEEIGGMPIITMELLSGGTLKDRVTAEGPLPIADAVAAVLDIIGGLDAAQAAGVLHRDIKPSNCFIEHDGTVKVGDFGLSISTLARDVEAGVGSGGFEGTPQFAPPEQLRGEPLDVRADIYAVGATLYFILTGRPPFDAPDLQALVARVTTEPPPSPRTHRPDVPAGLAAVVLACLARDPVDRPATYAALADLLRPFAPRAHRPAPLGLRFVAGLVDSAILAVPVAAWTAASGNRASAALANWAFGVGLHLSYYLLLEGVWGASPGKWLLGLRVMSAAGTPAAMRQILVRTLVFLAGTILAGAPVVARFGPAASSGVSADRVAPILILIMLFATIRRRNGWAGAHELISRTRVVTRSGAAAPAARRVDAVAVDARPVSHGRCGPFVLTTIPRSVDAGQVAAGFDPQLRRRVWIHLVPPGTPPVPADRRDAARATRLRWLTGRRGPENWDAYEAPDGEPFVLRSESRVAWPALKRWLIDLANELTAAGHDGSLPPLSLDRILIRSDGRLTLSDFPLAAATSPAAREGRTPVGLFAAVASESLGGVPDPGALPLSARHLFRRLDVASPRIEEVRDEVARWTSAPDRVDWWRRAVPIGLSAAPVVILAATALVLVPSLGRFANPDTGTLLGLLEDLRRPAEESSLSAADRAALERYVAGRWGAVLRDGRFWEGALMQNLERLRPVADGVLARHPSVDAAEREAVPDGLAAHIARAEAYHQAQASQIAQAAGVMVTALVGFALAVVVAFTLLSALLVPGGIVARLLGLAVVDRDGSEIHRGRSLARAVMAWSPALAWLAYLALSPKVQGWVPAPGAPVLSTLLALGLLAAGAATIFLWSGRGVHDRLAGTWVVVR